MLRPMYSNEVSWRPVVAVPAKNEAERLPRLLAALSAQTWLAKSSRPLDVVVVLNNCDDHSAEIMRMEARRYSSLRLHLINVQLPPVQAHVGSARRLAMERARDIGGPSSILFSTDADAVPAVDWIEASLRAIRAGADIVGGHIIGDKKEEALLGKAFIRRATRHLEHAELVDHLISIIDPILHDPWPRHSDHTGASIAIRNDVYNSIGGMPALPFREDTTLVSRAVAAGYRLRHSLDVRVGVSARLEGRARGGMADCLKAWMAAETAGVPQLVEDPASVCFRLLDRRRRRSVSTRKCHSCSEVFLEKAIELPRDIEGKGVQKYSKSIEIGTAIERLKQIIANIRT
jgi:Glycosyl transferase family 2